MEGVLQVVGIAEDWLVLLKIVLKAVGNVLNYCGSNVISVGLFVIDNVWFVL